jgi:23S rRNA pseudouridine1911/1915/1917 synthase
VNKKVIQTFKVKKAEAGERLDIFLVSNLGVTRSKAQKLIRDSLVTVNSEPEVAKYLVEQKDTVCVSETQRTAVPDVEIIFEDKDILVIDKPAGITAHPAPGENDITIAEIFADKWTAKGASDREMIVHRLDKGTSGVMILAKNAAARDSLIEQFANRKVTKTYLAVVSGKVAPREGVIDMPLMRDLVLKNRIAPAEEGKDAKTIYEVVRYLQGYSLVSASPKTGRTHQIRVHFSAIGHPLYGDLRYGARETGAERIFLHAHALSFKHPTTGVRVKYKSELPVELKAILDKLTS